MVEPTARAPEIRVSGSAQVGDTPLFDNLDLSLAAGGWTCILGVSGVGKTTILRLIVGLKTGATFSGTIAAGDGLPIPRQAAYMAQNDMLLPWATALKNVVLGSRLRGDRVDRVRARHLLERVGLGGHIHKKPHALSGGQRQRVALARTLMEDRALVLLDEPFSALDARTRAGMQELAHELLAGRTVLLVTHDPGEAARLADRLFVMTEVGCKNVQPPATLPPRPIDDPEVLHAQAQLLASLRGP